MGYSIKLKKERKKLVIEIEFAILEKKRGFMISSFLKNYFARTLIIQTAGFYCDIQSHEMLVQGHAYLLSVPISEDVLPQDPAPLFSQASKE